jgi:hypothetical protein
MGITLKHLKSLMSRDRRYLHRIKSLFEKATGGLVPEIVEMKPGDPRFLTSFGKVL